MNFAYFPSNVKIRWFRRGLFLLYCGNKGVLVCLICFRSGFRKQNCGLLVGLGNRWVFFSGDMGSESVKCGVFSIEIWVL